MKYAPNASVDKLINTTTTIEVITIETNASLIDFFYHYDEYLKLHNKNESDFFKMAGIKMVNLPP